MVEESDPKKNVFVVFRLFESFVENELNCDGTVSLGKSFSVVFGA